MGLDMFLYKKTFVKNYSFRKPSETYKISVKQGKTERTDIKKERICYIVEEVGYWRNLRPLHNWFVENAQEGTDDCKEYFVDFTKIEELLELLQKVIKYKNKPNKIKALFPKDWWDNYDFSNEFFITEIEDTIKILEEEVKNCKDDSEFSYQASW